MVDENSVVDRNSIKLVDESSVVVENTGLKLEEVDEKTVVYQSVFSRWHVKPEMVTKCSVLIGRKLFLLFSFVPCKKMNIT